MSDLAPDCYSGTNATVTLSCQPFNWVGTATDAAATVDLEYYYPKMADAYNHFMLTDVNWKSTIPPWVYIDWSAGTASQVTFTVDQSSIEYESGAFGAFKITDCVAAITAGDSDSNQYWDAWWTDDADAANCNTAALI